MPFIRRGSRNFLRSFDFMSRCLCRSDLSNLFKLLKKRIRLGSEIVENSVKLVFLIRQGSDRQVTAVISEDDSDAFARFDHALDEHHFTRRHAHSPCYETTEQHLDRLLGGDTRGWACADRTTAIRTCVRWYAADPDFVRGAARAGLDAKIRIGAHLFVTGYRLSGAAGGIIVRQ
jgi:hypothetical protein